LGKLIVSWKKGEGGRRKRARERERDIERDRERDIET